MELWLIILFAGLLTYALRLSFIAAHGRFEMRRWFTRALTFVPVAVLCAIIAPELLTPGGALNVSLGNARLVAGVVAILFAWQTKNGWLTIAAGMVVLVVVQLMH